MLTACGPFITVNNPPGNDQQPPGSPGPTGPTGPGGSDGQDGNDGIDGDDMLEPGIMCDVYNVDSWNSSTRVPEVFNGNTYAGTFMLNNFSVGDSPSANGFPGMPTDIQNIVGLEGYGLDCYSHLYVKTSGDYKIKFMSDDGAELRFNDTTIISNQGLHAPTTVQATVRLNKGLNKINVVYYQGPNSQIALSLKWSCPNLAEQIIPVDRFWYYDL